MIEQAEPLAPPSDERVMAALAHFFGLIASLIVWAVQKDKSRFLRFQSMQALAFDFIVMLFVFVLFSCLFGVIFLSMLGTMFAGWNGASSSENFGWFMVFPLMLPSLMFTCIFPFSLALLITRIVAAVSVLNGSNFRYPVLGTKVEQFLTD